MTRWLVTGAGGMLGRDVVDVLRHSRPDDPVEAAGRADLEVTDARAVGAAVAGAVGPGDVVVHCAAWTDVDGAEAAEDAALAVNGDGTRHVAAACADRGARMVHVSTDYVFDGTGTSPYREDDPPAPVNAYGRTKLAGERAVLDLLPTSGYVVRTAWLYGGHGPSFVATVLRLATDRETLDVVDDQLGQPTWSRSLAARLVALGATGPAAPPGVYHGTASGATSWYGLARAVFAEAGLDPERVRPTTSDRFPRPAPRPAYSVLGHDRWRAAGLAPLPDWRPMLAEAAAAGVLDGARSLR